MSITVTDTVKKATEASMLIGGYKVPREWNFVILTKAGLPDFPAIYLLGYIWHWYMAEQEIDEITGLINIKKKFKYDKLHLPYENIMKGMNYSKNQAHRALHKLKDMELITIEYRTLVSETGKPINTIFVEPIVDNIIEITEKGRLIINNW